MHNTISCFCLLDPGAYRRKQNRMGWWSMSFYIFLYFNGTQLPALSFTTWMCSTLYVMIRHQTGKCVLLWFMVTCAWKLLMELFGDTWGPFSVKKNNQVLSENKRMLSGCRHTSQWLQPASICIGVVALLRSDVVHKKGTVHINFIFGNLFSSETSQFQKRNCQNFS